MKDLDLKNTDAPRGSGRAHDYAVKVTWTGNTGAGTETYRSYRRDHIISAPGKEISGSSDKAFRGDANRWNPEELLLAALSACHKLQYLHACAEAGIIVDAYTDEPTARMLEDGRGGGSFTSATLKPHVTLRNPAQRTEALALHAIAHTRCFIAASVRFPIQIDATFTA